MTVLRKLVKHNFSRAASEYDARAEFQHGGTARVVDAALMLLPEKARIVDVGCGTGQFAAMTQGLRPAWRVLGVDIAAGMCKAAASRCAPIQADAAALPLADDSCEGVVSSLCLQWVEDLDAALREIHRVLRPGGRAIIASLAAGTLEELRAATTHAELNLGLLTMRADEEYRASIDHAGLAVTLFKCEADVEYYTHVNALLDSMRRIGAGNNFAHQPNGLMGARRWKAMLRYYESLRTPQGIPATWNRLFMILHKPL